MANFEYLAIWNDHSKQTWVISAEKEADAKSSLHKLWFAILKISETSKKADTDYETQKKALEDASSKDKWKKEDPLLNLNQAKVIKFEFSWFDTNWDKTTGSIESNNEITAYKRLVEEFWIDVEWLVLNSLSAEEKNKKKGWSVVDVINLAYEQWVEINDSKIKTAKEKLDLGSVWSKEEYEQTKFEVEEFLKKITKLTENHWSALTPIEHSEIKKKKFELEKIKRSNNIFYIQNELNSILEYIIKRYNKDVQAKLDDESLKIIHEINLYLWIETKSAIYEKILTAFEKYNFLKTILKKIKSKISSSISPEIEAQSQRISKYYKQLFYHIKKIFFSSWEDRKKHMRIVYKSWRLIVNSYETYFRLKKKISEQRAALDKKLIQNTKKWYQEVRDFTWWVLAVYICYYAILSLAITKGILINNTTASFATLNSPLLNTFIFFIFTLNLALLIKIKNFNSQKITLVTYASSVMLVYLFYNNF